MSNDNSPPQTPLASNGRRASFAPTQKLSELFGRAPGNGGNSGGAAGVSPYPGSIAVAAANAQAQQRRRMSISTLGLSGSPTQTSPFTSPRPRQDSYSSGSSGYPDESAVEEGDAGPNNTPSSPFARRMSFGAKALRDVRGGNGGFNGRASTSSASSSSPSVKGRGEGFNWSDQLMSRAQRSSSITGIPNTPAPPVRDHQRAASLAVVEPPVKEMPKAAKAPDHFQERILKGDFYMD